MHMWPLFFDRSEKVFNGGREIFWENGAGTTGFDKERERVEGRKEGREGRSVGGRAKESLFLSHMIHKN